jgi:electron transfer flavoprotein alpha subunit
MSTVSGFWVFSEIPALLMELIAGARSLAAVMGGEVVALVIGPRAGAAAALASGADRVFWLGELKAGNLVEDYVPTLAALVEKEAPRGLLVGATTRGRAVAGRLAARSGVTALTDVRQFTFEDGVIKAHHMIFGGGALRIERPLSKMMLATVGPGTFEAQPPHAGCAGDVIDVPFIEPEWRVTRRESKPRPLANINLAAAKKVVCAGRGLVRQEDLTLVEELAQALGAEVACTRPLAEGLGWLPRERYIGISGAIIKPNLYLGVGVSGQVQHTVGMREARLVVAINKDHQAPIFAQADYGIAGNLYAIVPALIAALKEKHGR